MSEPLDRRAFLTRSAQAAALGLTTPLLQSCLRATRALPALASGPFQPTWDSLKQYRAPDWFRDAKFGIWAHWGPQCQPERGDWYAREMYLEGSRDYQDHLARCGHPSQAGFNDRGRRRWSGCWWTSSARTATCC